MQTLIGRLFLVPLLAVVAALSLSTQAFAADTWQPRFNPSQHVYVEPALTSSANAPVNVSGLEQDLVQFGQKHNLQIFFVMAERGTENIDNAQFGARMIDRLLASWQGSNGFPADNYVLITVYRLPGGDWQKTARGGNLGPRAISLGLTVSQFQDIVNAHKGRLQNNDVRGFVRNAAGDVNSAIDARIAQAAQAERDRIAREAQAERDRIAREAQEREDAARRAEQMKTFVTVATYGGPPLVIIIVLGVLFFVTRRKRAQAEGLLNGKRSDAQNLGARYTELEDNYLGFLDSNKGWDGRLKNRSLTEFRAAVALYSQLTTAKLAFSGRFDAAQAAFDGNRNPFYWSGYNKTIELLTVAQITVTGAELTDDQRTLFGGTVQEKTYELSGLMTEMEDVYKSCKSKLSALKTAMHKVRENQGDVARLIQEVEDMKPQLTAAELTFDPYTETMASLTGARDAFIAIMNSDPLEASDDSQAVEDGVEALKKTLTRAVTLKASLTSTATAIETSAQKVAATRGKPADYNYPEVGNNAVDKLPVNLLLAEETGNPDTQLKNARDFLASAGKHVLAGQLDKADEAKASAAKEAKAAADLVDAIVAAAAFIQAGVPNIRKAVSKLSSEITGGDADVDELKAGFLKKNYEGQPEKLVAAKSVRDKTEAELAKVKKAFFEQRYLAGRELLETLGSDIQTSRDAIVEVDTCLKTLKANREHAKSTVASAADLAAALVRKLKSNDFTTSRATDDAYAAQQPVLTRQKADVELDVTDWPAAAKAADELLGKLKGIDGDIDTQKRAYENAKIAISNLGSAVKASQGNCDHDYIRQPALNKLAEGEGALDKANGAIKVAKSDWNAIAAATEKGKDACTKANELSAADKKAGTEAQAAINAASTKITSVEGKDYSDSKTIGGRHRTFGQNVSANTSNATSELRSARTKMSSKDYEGAKKDADDALRAAKKAESDADAVTAAAIAAAITTYNNEQAEQRRQEEAASRSSSSNFDSGSSYSTSSSFDSGSSSTTSSNFD
jgi:hypothetical protein